MSQTPNEAPIQLLFDHLAQLPGDDGPIDMLPFAPDSDYHRALKLMVCKAIIGLLDTYGYLNHDVAPVDPPLTHKAVVKCRRCATELVQIATDADGLAMVDARMFIEQLSKLNPRCHHGVLTIEDMRAHMEREFYAAEVADNPQSGV